MAAKKMISSLAVKAFSETDGDERRMTALYIKLRVAQLTERASEAKRMAAQEAERIERMVSQAQRQKAEREELERARRNANAQAARDEQRAKDVEKRANTQRGYVALLIIAAIIAAIVWFNS